jgi:hypothetical protein
MGNAISFRLNPKCESDRKILAWLEAKSSQPGYLNQTELIKQALFSAMESEQGNHRMDGAGNQKHGRGIYQGGAGVLTEYG